MRIKEHNMTIFDIRAFSKELENEYVKKGYSDENLDQALYADPRYPKDRLIEVTGYDLENHKVLGLTGGKKCEITICPAAFNQGEEKVSQLKKLDPSTAWMGHKIDANMEKAIPVKSQLIVQQSVIEKNEPIISLIATRILRVVPESENTFAGIFSTKSQTAANLKVQHWEQAPAAVAASIEKLRNESSASSKPKNNLK